MKSFVDLNQQKKATDPLVSLLSHAEGTPEISSLVILLLTFVDDTLMSLSLENRGLGGFLDFTDYVPQSR